MSATSSQLSEEPTWTLEFHSAKTVRSEVTQHSPAKSKEPSASNVTVHTNLNTTENLAGVAKPTPRSTHQDWKPRKASCVLIHSSVQTTVVITKPTPTCVCSGGTDLTGSGTKRNMLRSMSTDPNLFILKQTAPLPNDHQKHQDLFTKCLKEFSHRQYYPRNVNPLWHHPNPRTPLVWNMKDSQLFKLRRESSHRICSSPQLDFVCQNSISWQRLS